MSASAPPTTARGEDAANPARKRPNMIVSTFEATATGIWKMAKQTYPANRGSRRPSAPSTPCQSHCGRIKAKVMDDQTARGWTLTRLRGRAKQDRASHETLLRSVCVAESQRGATYQQE
jgi:hypothetical protein